MKTLVVVAHPSSHDFMRRVAEKYSAAARKNGRATEILDLYAAEWQQDFLKFEEVGESPMDSKSDKIQAKIVAADEIIFAFPLWWFDAPAILKNFFDRNFTRGFAFRYDKRGIPTGLLKGKTARIFTSSDAPAWFYRIIFAPFKRIWKMRLKTCDIKLKSFSIFGNSQKRDKIKTKKMLAKVAQLASSS